MTCVRAFFLFSLLGLAACAGKAPVVAVGEAERACLTLYRALDADIDRAGVRDAGEARLAGLPYLRVNRFLASFARQPLTPAGRTAWLARLAALDRKARGFELANLPGGEKWRAPLADCQGKFAPPFAAVRQRARVPDDYSWSKRLFGLYALTAVPISVGFARWKAKTLRSFRQPMAALKAQGALVDYAPTGTVLSAAEVARLVARSRDPALGIPELSPGDLARLFASFAPIWRIDTRSDDDRPGAPGWRGERIVVDPAAPVVYTLVSYARIGGRVALQLNYAIWFPARTKTSGLDMLAGSLDGILWRVTLGADGAPLLYDAIHQCGCYHLFFPGPRLTLRAEAMGKGGWDGAPTPQPAPVLAPGERVVIRLAPASHYILKLGREWPGAAARPYRLADYDGLRSLPLAGGGRRSLFGPDGVIAQSRRPERHYLWPMGIKSAGAMRQWGTHATAFVGRRHFDDPDLIEKTFYVRGGGGQREAAQ